MTRAVLMPPGSDIFASGCEALVNPVDCTGAQGKGLALAFRRRWPATAAAYKRHAQAGGMGPGATWVSQYRGPTLVFVATKDHWRNNSRVEWIQAGLHEIRRVVAELEIVSIALPALGVGLGGLPWTSVKPLLLDAAERMRGVEVKIYEPW